MVLKSIKELSILINWRKKSYKIRYILVTEVNATIQHTYVVLRPSTYTFVAQYISRKKENIILLSTKEVHAKVSYFEPPLLSTIVSKC